MSAIHALELLIALAAWPVTAGLGSDDFDDRQRASAALAKMPGWVALPIAWSASRHPDAEVEMRGNTEYDRRGWYWARKAFTDPADAVLYGPGRITATAGLNFESIPGLSDRVNDLIARKIGGKFYTRPQRMDWWSGVNERYHDCTRVEAMAFRAYVRGVQDYGNRSWFDPGEPWRNLDPKKD